MAVDRKDKFLGGMIGSALGDAIGELAFRNPDKQRLLEQIDRQKELVYTDDTAMAIGLAESIRGRAGIDQRHLGETFACNYEREPWRGYAVGPPTIFRQVRESGLSFVEAARGMFGGSGSFGNGAAMRIAPLGLYLHNSETLYDEACASAAVTHAHPVGMDGAAIQALAVAGATALDPDDAFDGADFISALIAAAKSSEIREKMQTVRTLLTDDTPPAVAARRLGHSVAVHESMPFAVYAFLRHPKSFEDCLFCAVLHGGDRDTLGAMAGAASGAFLGARAIPASWQDKLENRDYIAELAESLAAGAALSQ
jgi:poly(ADP-ribose) glycohydrolase ARH3